MRRFLRLLHKEWRDHRALILAWACLAPILSQVVQWALMDHAVFWAEITGRWVLPSLELLFMAALAPELVARETQAGVGDSLGRLPAKPGFLWFTKLAFLVSVGILSMSWLFLAESGWRALLDRPVAPVLEAFRGATLSHVWLLTGTALVFACGTVVHSGFAAAILGLGITFGSVFVLRQALEYESGVRLMSALSLWSLSWWTAVIVVAALLASRLAYRPWRGRQGDVTRRFVLFGTGLFLVLAPVGLAAARRYGLATKLSFYDARVEIYDAAPSPDGRFVALTVGMGFPGWIGQSYWGGGITELWVLDLDTGSLSKLPGSPQYALPSGYGRGSPWTDGGELWGAWSKFDHRIWNPRDGSVTRQDLGALDLSWRWWRHDRKEGEHLITWPERGIEATFPLAGSFPIASPEPGVVFAVDERGRLRRHTLLDGASEVLLENCRPSEGPFISTDGRLLAMNHGDLARYFDAGTGESLAVTPAGWQHHSWTGRSDPWALCARADGKGGKISLLLISDDEQRKIPVGGLSVSLLDRNRLLVLEDYDRLLLVDGEGHTLRTLYEPREDD